MGGFMNRMISWRMVRVQVDVIDLVKRLNISDHPLSGSNFVFGLQLGGWNRSSPRGRRRLLELAWRSIKKQMKWASTKPVQ